MHVRLSSIPFTCRFALVAGVASLATAARVHADDSASGAGASTDKSPAIVAREEIVISASRSRQDARYTASSVTLLSLPELKESQILDLRSALAREPGASIVTTGATGSQSSIFLRGGSSHQTLLFVDGVRMNDRSAAYVNFLGGADLAGLGRLEVLRGPQSTLYGSSAMGGVIAMDTLGVGDGPAHGRVTAGGGSFGTWGAGIEAQGGAGALGYSASAAYLDTDNDRPGNGYDVWNTSARLQFAPSESPVLLGATWRRQDGSYEEPGSTQSPFPGQVDSTNSLGTLFAEVMPFDGLTSRLTAALHERDYRYISVPDTWGMGPTVTENRREIVDWQNTWSATERLELVGGANYERSRYRINSETTRDEVAAGYVSATYRALETLTLTAGARLDDFDSFGSAVTGRGGLAWNATPATKVRVTYGTGFAAPGSDDRFGVPQWGQVGNPDLRPEKVRGWDAGIDQTFLGGDVVASATWFRHDYRNLFEWQYVNLETFEGRTVNRARATTQGVETALAVRITAAVKGRFGYTYLDARNDSDDVRLVRRPRHALDAEVTARVAAPWIVGLGAHAVVDRVDAAGPLEDYTLVRAFASYRAAENILLKVRVENLFDEEYEEVPGYPALPVGIFGAVEWAF